MSLVKLAQVPVSELRLSWPAWGLWWAEARLVEPAELSGALSLDVAGTAFRGTVTAGGPYGGRAAYRLVAGAGGINTPLPEKSYVNTAGVALAQVLADAARSAGEAIDVAPATGRLGPHYARRKNETLGDLLQRHYPQGWYVDLDGTIRIGLRASAAYEGTAPRVREDAARGVVDLAIDTLEGLAPGVRVDGRSPASDIDLDLSPERMTARVYSAPRLSARAEAYRKIVRAVLPSLAYQGTWEYRVVTQDGERLNLQPARVASGMPSLRSVPIRPGVPGVKARVLPGELVLVCFADGDPSRPQVIAHDAADAPGWMPLEWQLGGPAALPVAYQGSAVQAGPFSGTVVVGSTLAKVRP